MGSKTRLSSYCTKRANNEINTRLARPISMLLCERKALAAKMVKRERKTDNIDFKTSLVFYPVYTEQNYLDRDQDCNLDCKLDCQPEDVPVYTGHSLFNTTKRVTLFFIVTPLLHRNPPYI